MANNNGDSDAQGNIPPDYVPPKQVVGMDVIFESLAHRRRRCVCCMLLKRQQWALDEMVATIAAWEAQSANMDEQSLHTRVHTALSHTHLPKLVEMGVIRFDDDTETITRGANARPVLSALQGIGVGVENAVLPRQGEVDTCGTAEVAK